MQALLNVLFSLLPLPEGSKPVELIPAALMVAAFIGVALFGFAMSLYDSWQERKN
jgi:hypothetical protein